MVSRIRERGRSPGRTLVSLLAACLIAAALPATASAAWIGPVEVSAAGTAAASPQVAVDGAGNITAVWMSGTSPSREIRSAFRPVGGPWQSSFTRIPSAQDCFDPKLAVNPAGAAVVVADCGAASMYAAYRPAGGSWQGSIAIPGSNSGDGPSVGIDDAGNVIAVWSNGTTVQSAYRPAAGPWAAGGQVSPSGNVAVDPQVAMSPTGTAVAVWRHRLERTVSPPDNVVTVESTYRTGAGSWFATPNVLTRPAATTTVPVAVDKPQIRINRSGAAFAVWGEDPPAASTVRLASGWSSVTNGTWQGYFSTQLAIDPVRDVEAPQVAFSNSGASVAVWRGANPLASTAGVPQVSTTSSISTGWTTPVTLADSELTLFGEPQVASDPAGGSTVMWRQNTGTMYAVHRPAGGAFGTPVPLTSQSAFGIFGVTMNATGDTIATWPSTASSPTRTVVDVDDVTPPKLSAVDVPTAATAGTPIAVSAAATDEWSEPVSFSWDFGDGATVSGATATHTYAGGGTRTVTVTATDAVGNVATDTRQVAVTGTGGTGALTLGVDIPKQSWKKIRKAGGIKLKCSIDAVGRCDVEATISSKVAKRLGLKAGKPVGSGTGKVSEAGATATLLVKLKRKALEAIAEATKNVPVKLGVEGTATGRDPASLTRKLAIKR